MEKMSETQSPHEANEQRSQQAHEEGADSGQTWVVAKQVEKRNRDTKMNGGGSRERGVGRWVAMCSFF